MRILLFGLSWLGISFLQRRRETYAGEAEDLEREITIAREQRRYLRNKKLSGRGGRHSLLAASSTSRPECALLRRRNVSAHGTIEHRRGKTVTALGRPCHKAGPAPLFARQESSLAGIQTLNAGIVEIHSVEDAEEGPLPKRCPHARSRYGIFGHHLA